MWQMYALSSVLCVPIISVYPELGNQIVRKHLNRIVYPRNPLEGPQTVHILWTSIRTDMLRHNWIPNHFVPLSI